MESVNSAHFKRWETKVQNFGKEKRKTLRQYWAEVHIFGQEKCKTHRQI